MSTQIHPGHAAREPLARSRASRLAGRAVVAGIIGGILVDLFLIVVHAAPFPMIYQFVASTVVGKVALTSASYIWLGVAIHFAVSIAWALIYAYAANAMHAIQRWALGGLVLGVAVMIVMELLQMIAGSAQSITVRSEIVTLISHVVFFGWPVAWYLAWATRPKGIATLGLNTPKSE